MKILMLTPYVPYPPTSGARIRQWEQIKYLGTRHDLTLVCFTFAEEEAGYGTVLKNYCKRVLFVRHPFTVPLAGLPASHEVPWPVMTFSTEKMKDTLEKIGQEDLEMVITDFIYMAQYRDAFSCPVVLQEHNIESNLFKQYADLRDTAEKTIMGVRKDRAFWVATWMFMTAYENKMWAQFPLRFTVSANDRTEMDNRCRAGRTVVIENGVNTLKKEVPRNGKSKKILFMGTMNYYPNIDAVLYLKNILMPLIWEKDAWVELCVAGMNPPKEVLSLAEDSRVEVISSPSDMRSVAEECCLSVVPLRLGGGYSYKNS
jgi:hypothetical protein